MIMDCTQILSWFMPRRTIYLPVSLGEAIDKLTILDIKLQKIKDKRGVDVKIEYGLLRAKLGIFVEKYADLYETMKRVNLLIWDMMDVLRDGALNETDYLKTCKECIEYNDIRFRIKNKINYVSNSRLKEQKGYNVTRAIIEMNDDIENIDSFIRPIKYYSVFYDELIIVSNHALLRTEFSYDPTISFFTSTSQTQDMEYKRRWTFQEKEYSDERILDGFELSNEVMRILM